MTIPLAQYNSRQPPPELPGSDREHFEAIAHFAHKTAGLVLPKDKAPMVLARIAKRMRRLGYPTLGHYREFLESSDGTEERKELIFVLTTNVTSFLRERHHFDALRSDVLPGLVETARGGGRVRLWSAGCSTGQEPYSLAMVLLDAFPDASRHDVRILATDIDCHVLKVAREATYPVEQTSPLPNGFRDRFFEAAPGVSDTVTVSREVRDLVTFRELNLLSEWPMNGAFDVILCRNVVIYFDRETQNALWTRFHRALQREGHLILGHSERLGTDATTSFKTVGTTMYRRVE